MARQVRILCTHDFLASYAPLPTSYGTLPGGEALRATVAAIKAEGPAIWADTGDFAHVGPLSTLSQGALAFDAANELGIDVGTLGNHELDHELAAFRTGVEKLDHQLLCANLSAVGLPATTLIETEAGLIGFVGLTHPDLGKIHSGSAFKLPAPDRGATMSVIEAAASLRRAGAAAVVVLIHDGVDWRMPNGRLEIDTTRLAALLRDWQGKVDLVCGGHTLGQHFGTIAGIPYAQPWPYGSEIGVVDLRLEGGTCQVGAPRGLAVAAGAAWSGTGAALLDEAQDDVLGTLAAPLIDRIDGSVPLAHWLADAIRAASGADLAIGYSTCGQPTLDGAFAALPAGRISRLNVMQATPWTDGRLVAATFDADDVAALARRYRPAHVSIWEAIVLHGAAQAGSLVTTSGYMAALISGAVGHPVDWQPVSMTLYDCVRKCLRCPLV